MRRKCMGQMVLAVIGFLGFCTWEVQASTCKAYQCNDQIGTHFNSSYQHKTCASSDDDTVFLNPGICDEGQECFFLGNETGQCASKISRNFPALYYPGYNCRYEKKPGVCAFGSKYCNKYGMCDGGTLDDVCQRHADCYAGFYCNPYGRCVPSKEEGEACVIHEECKRGMMCFEKCIPYLTLEADSQVVPEYNRQVFQQFGNEKMCESAWYNRTTGRCFAGVKSIQKGKVCLTDLDCPTTVEDIFAQCKCGFSVKGQKYCDVEGDDDEWQEVKEAFDEYRNTTRESCHQAEGMGECYFNEAFKTWKCKELKALLYVYFIDQPDCWDDIKFQHPLFAEWAYYCESCTWSMYAVFAAFSIMMASTL